jgi:hypothetical protein
MPPAERRALLLLLALAVAGQGVRHFVTRPGEAPGQVQLVASLPAGSPVAQRDSAMRQARPLAAGERVDVDIAGAAELVRLPKVGPRLAKTIVADREADGPFGSLEGLDRVAGVGPGLLKVIGPHVIFSGTAGPGTREAGGGSGAVVLDHKGTQCSEVAAPLPRCPPAQRAPAPLQLHPSKSRFRANTSRCSLQVLSFCRSRSTTSEGARETNCSLPSFCS